MNLGPADYIHLRPAVEADLDDLVTILIDAFAPGPVWRYIFPHLDKYYDSLWHCFRTEIAQEFDHVPNTTFINVIEKPKHTIHDFGPRRVVGIGIWNLLSPNPQVQLQSTFLSEAHAAFLGCNDNPAVNQTRVLHYAAQADRADRYYIRNRRQDQFYLNMLATHPDWDGHGFGAANLDWGFKKAKSLGGNIPITLLATPAGWPLYDKSGFESVANFTITSMDDDMDDFWFEYMRVGNFTNE
ncbi:hypothetical protein B0I35DRAFT_482089 [Stachybotrys elegans]|uniref:N-acetyltransferase domain-containing protein n=1 Tax=Stachybotrys elegans TaxID=80388 RepID=A0A8K0SI91_9HYPO|nr:hypothetical protein B0I35DRAFT_482089 [Stachybotrys elegans]